MRISTNYQYTIHNQDMSDALTRMTRASQVVSSGVKLDAMSEDPYAGSLVLNLRSALANVTQYQNNAGTAESKLKAADNAVGELSDMMTQVKTLVLQGANGSTDQKGRDAIVTQLNTIEQQLVSIGNREYMPGQYLFAGQSVTTQPFTAGNGTLTYNGDHNAMNVEVQKGQSIQANVVGDQLFTDIYNALETAKTDLASGNVQRLGNEDVNQLDAVASRVLAQQADVGARLQQLADATTQLGKQADGLKSLISDNRDADMTEAISEYQAAQTAYQAALAASATATKMSLLDYIGGGTVA